MFRPRPRSGRRRDAGVLIETIGAGAEGVIGSCACCAWTLGVGGGAAVARDGAAEVADETEESKETGATCTAGVDTAVGAAPSFAASRAA